MYLADFGMSGRFSHLGDGVGMDNARMMSGRYWTDQMSQTIVYWETSQNGLTSRHFQWKYIHWPRILLGRFWYGRVWDDEPNMFCF